MAAFPSRTNQNEGETLRRIHMPMPHIYLNHESRPIIHTQRMQVIPNVPMNIPMMMYQSYRPVFPNDTLFSSYASTSYHIVRLPTTTQLLTQFHSGFISKYTTICTTSPSTIPPLSFFNNNISIRTPAILSNQVVPPTPSLGGPTRHVIPIPNTGVVGTTNTPATTPSQFQHQTQREHRCFQCDMSFSCGSALGGHMSSHAKKRKLEAARSGKKFKPAESFFDNIDSLGFQDSSSSTSRSVALSSVASSGRPSGDASTSKVNENTFEGNEKSSIKQEVEEDT